MTLGLYVPGRSVLHRMPAVGKLLLLAIAAVASAFVSGPRPAIIAVVVVLGLFVVAEIDARTTWAQARPIAWFAVPLAAFHLLITGWEQAVRVVGTLVALVLLAALVSVTTRVTDMCDAVVRAASPLRRLGVDTERLGLLVGFGIRAVPVMVGLAQEVREAQRARGASASPTAFLLPVVLRALRHADRQAEAMLARGLDD